MGATSGISPGQAGEAVQVAHRSQVLDMLDPPALRAVVLRVLGPERFQRATFWLQIAFMTFFIGGFQFAVAFPPVGFEPRQPQGFLDFLLG